ncbi:hypothetical protein QEZ54_15850 [Catellatospora sp. KI3]|uniref:hypothetical protein n=1 Tax=Catellatospora sp. KI3 TaxID=3041620 RepID=UPI0024827C6B|nr:hypothetical protein [Catellatospora sp. KI3]MDI1462445.1 hypothetical protein [Catellatospora sp. KI3]
MDERELHFRLWQEERAALLGAQRLAVLWSGASLVVYGLVAAALILAGRDLGKDYDVADATGPTVGAGAVFLLVGAFGVAVAGLCLRDATAHSKRSEVCHQHFGPASPDDPKRVLQYRAAGQDSQVNLALVLLHLAAAFFGVVLVITGNAA